MSEDGCAGFAMRFGRAACPPGSANSIVPRWEAMAQSPWTSGCQPRPRRAAQWIAAIRDYRGACAPC